MADVYGQAVVVQEISTDDWHEDVRDDKAPGVAVGTVVEGKLFVSVGWDE